MAHTPSAHRIWILVGSGLLSFGLTGCSNDVSNKDLVFIEVDALETVVDARPAGVLVIDARPVAQFEAGALPGAVNVQLDEVPERKVMQMFGSYQRVIVYGHNAGSPRAEALSKRLLAGGMESVETYRDGYEEWVRDGGPTVVPDAP
jgi:rhodanese-related sulfurtransferase